MQYDSIGLNINSSKRNGINQMSHCHVSNQIANHCNEEEATCTDCGSQLEEKSNVYGTWFECTNNDCDYETEQK